MIKTSKKRYIGFCTAFLLLSSPSFAATNASDKSVEDARKLNVNNMLKQLNYLTNLTVRYVNSTLDTTPTRGEIENYFNKKDKNIWRNYRNEDCAKTSSLCTDNTSGGIALLFDTTNSTIEFSNVMGDLTTLSVDELATYQNYKNYDGIGQLSLDQLKINFDFLNFPSLENTLKVIDECDNNTQLTCSLIEPADTTQYWKKPKGDGTFDTIIYNETEAKWINKSKYSSLSDETLLYKSSEFDKITTPGAIGDSILVNQNNVWVPYVHDGTKWVVKTTGADTIADTTATIDPLLNRGGKAWYDADIGTEVSVTNLFINSSVKFKKETDYWKSSVEFNVPKYNSSGYVSKYIYLTDDVSKLPAEATNAIAYSTQNNDGAGFTGNNQEFEFYYDGAKWQNTAYTLEDLLLLANTNLQDGSYWIMETYSLYTNEGYAVSSSTNNFTYWKENTSDSAFRVITRGDRSDLTSPSDSNRINLTYILGDDDTYSANGLNSTYSKADGTKFKYWLFTNSSFATKKVNNMTDYQGICNSLSECYSNNYEVALFQDELIVLTDTAHWQKPDTTLYPKCKTGFIWVPGTSPSICVAKYEMTPYSTSGWARQYDAYRYDSPGSNTNVTSRAGQNPITYVSTNDARTLCSSKLVDQNSNTISGGTSMKWLTHKIILKDLALNPINWSGGSVGSGFMYSGHNDNSPALTLSTSADDTNGYAGTGNTAPSNQKRTLQFSNGETIWDYAGNVWELMYETQNVGSTNGWEEYTNPLSNPFESQNIVDPSYNWSSAQGVGGKAHAGASNLYESNIGTGSYLLIYGGYLDGDSHTGLFTSYWHATSMSSRNHNVGFRCIYPAE